MLPVGLHQNAVTDTPVLDRVTHGDDPTDRLMPGHDRLGVRLVAGDLGQLLRGQPSDHVGLARVRIEGVQQLGVGEADPAGLDLEQQLVRARSADRLVGDDLDLVETGDQDGVLGGGETGHRCV